MTYLEFAIDGSELVGLCPVSPTACQYLGRVPIGQDGYAVTRALRQFCLLNARAPQDWPALSAADAGRLIGE